MCSINHDLKSIYIHIPKNGGSYINTVLMSYYKFKNIRLTREDHNEFNENFDEKYNKKFSNMDDDEIRIGFVNIRTKGILRYYMGCKEYNEKIGMDEEKWNNYYKFTFIRNPYDKIVSAYNFINKNCSNKYKSFKEFLQNKDNCDNWEYSHAFITQYQNLIDLNENLKINYLASFDNMNSELVYILKNIGIDKISHSLLLEKNTRMNENKNYTPFYEYYDDETLSIVNELFKEDFENFSNYEHFGFKKFVNLSEFKKNSINY